MRQIIFFTYFLHGTTKRHDLLRPLGSDWGIFALLNEYVPFAFPLQWLKHTMVFVGTSLFINDDWRQFWGTCTSRSCMTTPLGSDCGVFVFIKRCVRKSEVPMIINASARPCVVSAQRDLSVLTALFIVCVCSALCIYILKKKKKAHCWLEKNK